MIKLFPHNEEAYRKLVESLKTTSLAFIEHATGTGKSFIMLKYLYEIMRENRILIVSMHYEMFEQLLGSQMKTLGISKQDFKKINTMIYHNIIKEDPKKLIEDYDCFIFDEAHHCGAKKWSKVVRELKELVKSRDDKKMIGFTATGTRYLDDYLDVSNEFFDGNTVSRLSVAEAILEGLLPAPLYVNSTTRCVNKIEYLLKLLKRSPKNEETIALQNSLGDLRKKVVDSSDVPSLINKYDIKEGEKYIVFCSSIDDLQQKMKEAESWFPYDVKMFAAHSRQSRDKNKEAIREFGDNKTDTCLMFAVDIFNEGFHIDDVDGIFMFRHTTSPIVYLQQIGRALSFSLRKKQIKIFDMVDNISDNDVILELYKEIIEESKRLIKEHPEKREFYEEILNRFQIVDNTNQIMDELVNIEEEIKNKYLIRNQVDQAILKLSEYCFMFPSDDIYHDLYRKKSNKSYLKAYRLIIGNRDYLTDEQIAKLNKLNIPFQGICLDLEIRRKELGNFKNYKELEEHKLKEFINNYADFSKNNGFRPRKNTIDDKECELYKDYRKFLASSNKKRILKLINANNLPSTVEELVLIGSIPTSDKIQNYLDHIRNNIINNIPLDEVEVRVFKRIKNAIWIDDEVLLTYFERQNDLGNKLDMQIKYIEDYLQLHPGEKFVNILEFRDESQIFNALKYIYKHALHITNYQFKKLLSLGINLPKSINMTWEERLALLGDYDSFYEKEQVEKTGFINKYINFLKTYSRRPNVNGSEEERELSSLYREKLYSIKANKLREITNIMKTVGIDLTIDEKLILSEDLSVDEYLLIYKNILSHRKTDFNLLSRDIKVLNRLLNNSNFLYQEEAKVLLASYKFAKDFYSSLYKLNNEERDIFLKKVYSNYQNLSIDMIDVLKRNGVDLPVDIAQSVSSLREYRTLNEQEKIASIRGKYEYIDYVRKYKRRPTDKRVCQLYRDYLASLYHKRLEVVLNEIKDSVGSLTIEEEILLGNTSGDVKDIVEHLKSSQVLDSLDRRIYRILFSNKLIDNIYATDRMEEHYFNNVVERNMYKRIMQGIKENPLQEISSYPEFHYLSSTEINRLRTYQINYLAKSYLPIILDKVRREKVTLENCLSAEELKVFKILVNCDQLDEAYREIIIKITQISYRNSFLEKKVDYTNFLNEYINFIIKHLGVRPSLISEEPEELMLAKTYNECVNLLSIGDIKRIDEAISVTINKEQEDNFFDNFVKFINDNKRFPCNNALDEDEIRLANTYINVNKKLTKDQVKYINMLRKKFAQNTINKTKEFNEMRKEQTNGKRKVETMLEFEQLINYYLSNDLPFSLLEEEYELSLKQRGFMLNRILDYAGKLDELEDTFTSDISDAYLKLPHNLEEKTPLSHDELMSLFVERKRIKDCILDIQKQVDVSMYQELLSEFNTKEIEIADYLCNHIDFSDIENFSKDRKSLKYYEELYNKYNLIKHDQENYIRLQLKDNQEYLNLMDQAATVDEEIIKRNIKLANWVIRLYFKRMPFEMEEAQGYALEGLMRAINGFDVSRGNHFSTYASLVIKRTIQKHFKDLVGISWRNYLLGLEYKRCVLEYQDATLNDNPTIEDLYNSNLFGMSMTELSVRKKYADIVTIPFTYLLPLDPLDMRDKRHDLLKTMEDYLEQDNYEDAYNTTLSLATPADEVGIYAENKILQEALQSLILTLPDEEAKIIRKRYGFDDGVFNSMDKVALEFNISKDKVYRVDKKVQRLLRHPLQAKLLRDFYLEKDLYEGNSNTYRGL